MGWHPVALLFQQPESVLVDWLNSRSCSCTVAATGHG